MGGRGEVGANQLTCRGRYGHEGAWKTGCRECQFTLQVNVAGRILVEGEGDAGRAVGGVGDQHEERDVLGVLAAALGRGEVGKIHGNAI